MFVLQIIIKIPSLKIKIKSFILIVTGVTRLAGIVKKVGVMSRTCMH